MAPRSADYHYLQSQMKSTGMAYVMWVLLGAHYAYLGRWGVQVLYWITLGGLGVWAVIDLFRIPGLVGDHNWEVAQDLEEIEARDARRQLGGA